VNPGDSEKKSGDFGRSRESGHGIFGVSGFHNRNPKSQCRTNQPWKLRDIADLEPIEFIPTIPKRIPKGNE
jgi:hypothetical protein